jgi:hypothetical protein
MANSIIAVTELGVACLHRAPVIAGICAPERTIDRPFGNRRVRARWVALAISKEPPLAIRSPQQLTMDIVRDADQTAMTVAVVSQVTSQWPTGSATARCMA